MEKCVIDRSSNVMDNPPPPLEVQFQYAAFKSVVSDTDTQFYIRFLRMKVLAGMFHCLHRFGSGALILTSQTMSSV